MKPILYATAALAFAAAAAPGAAQDGAPAPDKKTEKIVIIERAGAPHPDGAAREVHRFRLEGAGSGEDLAAHCAGQKDEVNAASDDGKQRTRILVCGNTQLSAAERAERLEHVLSRLEARDDLNAEQKAKVTAALREAIERVRSGQ
ncbi:MAG: hypothetical protein JO013_02320 [Alphaproteobacteria bacterium]|nr:hypothetical protein [Alphaproteobacteria bacterium]